MTHNSCFLKALTPEAKEALGAEIVELKSFPFRVGRESRINEMPIFRSDSRRRPDSTPNNDLYLLETTHILNVSREHFQIEQKDGSFLIVDRGSSCGTLVDGETVGGQRRGGSRMLQNQDVIIVGTSESCFVFKLLFLAAP